MKTPEEIKKGLEYCEPINVAQGCRDCPYDKDFNCCANRNSDALDYIRQLESRLAQVERERDAAVEDFTQFVNYGEHECKLCRHNEEVCLVCTWEWRGVKSNEDRRNQASNK